MSPIVLRCNSRGSRAEMPSKLCFEAALQPSYSPDQQRAIQLAAKRLQLAGLIQEEKSMWRADNKSAKNKPSCTFYAIGLRLFWYRGTVDLPGYWSLGNGLFHLVVSYNSARRLSVEIHSKKDIASAADDRICNSPKSLFGVPLE